MRLLCIVMTVFLAGSLCLGWADSLEAIRENSGNITSVRADFVQEKHLKILVRPLISKGIFVFQAPGSLRWEYRTPIQSLLLLHDGKMHKFVQHEGKLVEDRSMGMDAMRVVSQEISQWLSGNFTDNPTFQAELKPGRKIVLTPRSKGLGKLISRIELQLSEQPGLMDSVTIFEGKDSYTRLIFTNAVLNTTISPAVFTEK
ncbi:MAG: outer membrane lipoprotein carrier protein LolA [Desulfobulbus sp.]|nr:MAG: outer membrane lipoprotein carrier protein LolA [Desulfobulbus sp.]RUM40928.1 MAG: outer membrane lipoprotein carrier protein LolA [Desulfobulbus sp.]